MVLSPALVETAGDALRQVAPAGFAEHRLARGRRRLVAHLPMGASGRAALLRLRAALRRVARRGPGRGRLALTARVVDDAVWRDAWRRHARPVRVGRLTVQPPWMPPPASGAVVRLDAGMAFGSGLHPSTRLCLSALDRYVRGPSTVVDVGTGSGVLAIAAARLGAGRVLALDHDPVAVRVASANVRANGVRDRVEVRRASGLGSVRRRADLILANLTADDLCLLLPVVPARLRPGGRFVGSGLGPSRVPQVVRAAGDAGLRVIEVVRWRGWCVVHAVAKDAQVLG